MQRKGFRPRRGNKVVAEAGLFSTEESWRWAAAAARQLSEVEINQLEADTLLPKPWVNNPFHPQFLGLRVILYIFLFISSTEFVSTSFPFSCLQTLSPISQGVPDSHFSPHLKFGR